MSQPLVRPRFVNLWLCLTLALTAAAQPAAPAAPPPPESPNPPRHAGLTPPAYRAPAGGGASPHKPVTTQTLAPQSRVAFQSYRDGHWQIYAANDDGSGSLRLTNNGAADFEPRQTRGAARVAFTSNRTGTNQVIVMDASGGNVPVASCYPTRACRCAVECVSARRDSFRR